MRKTFLAVSVFAAGAFLWTVTADAQMINYKRRQKNTKTAPAVTTTTPVKASDMGSKRVANRTERQYDSNRDGYLQSSETRRFLADIIVQVQERGSYIIDSSVLNKYDSNNDGRISRYELGTIRRDLR